MRQGPPRRRPAVAGTVRVPPLPARPYLPAGVLRPVNYFIYAAATLLAGLIVVWAVQVWRYEP